MMKKNFYLLFILIFFNGCGYSPLYSTNNMNFSIEKINYEKTPLNNKFAKAIKSLNKKDHKQKISFDLNAEKSKIVKSKDSKGNPLILEMTIKLNVKTLNNFKSISRSIAYSNNTDKFELNRYERQIEENIINEIIQETIKYLTLYNDS